MSAKLHVLPNNYLILLKRSKKKIFEKSSLSKTFLLITYGEKTSYFEFASPGLAIDYYKKVDDLLKIVYYYIMLPKIWWVRKVQYVIKMYLKGF